MLVVYLDLLKVSFLLFCHGKSPIFTTIWEKMLYFYQASNKQIQV